MLTIGALGLMADTRSRTLTVYEPDGDVHKYFAIRVLPDRLGQAQIEAPRDKKVLTFNYFRWTFYYFVHTGHTDIVAMPKNCQGHL